jgi:putative tryptophan/tyrosine transport system substrate-binding protein
MKKTTLLLIVVVVMHLAVGVIAHAQQTGKIFRIGFLDPSTASGSAVLLDAFRQELRKLGWIEGKDFNIEYRFGETNLDTCLSLRRTWFVLRLI